MTEHRRQPQQYKTYNTHKNLQTVWTYKTYKHIENQNTYKQYKHIHKHKKAYNQYSNYKNTKH